VNLLVDLLTHLLTPVWREEHLALTLALMALLRHLLLHLLFLLVKHLPLFLWHLVLALATQLQFLRAVALKDCSFKKKATTYCLLQDFWARPLPHFLTACFLANLFHLAYLLEIFKWSLTHLLLLLLEQDLFPLQAVLALEAQALLRHLDLHL
jgi:hypothetical protein